MYGLSLLLSVFSVGTLVGFLLAALDAPSLLSPQGCRMSYMWYSYFLQTEFDETWTPLAKRYRLFLYREKDWQDSKLGFGVPVLFIPGNAGSYGQVRSIASSAATQYFISPGTVNPEFSSRELKSLDVFAVDFNEDLSAFHGPTMASEIEYTSKAISYILSNYPQGTQIIVMGHSMGGIVATSLLPSPDISAIITMSTPHTLPPARFDSRIDAIYDHSQVVLDSDGTPILSLCGGATDMMIPSESCIIPSREERPEVREDVFRRTVFSSALEGSWTGVGHREMVWCHQVRWRVARAALELGLAAEPEGRGLILDKWLRDGHDLPPEITEKDLTEALQLRDPEEYTVVPPDIHLVLKQPSASHTYLLPLPSSENRKTVKFVLYLSQGAIGPVAPQNSLGYSASVYHCLPSPADEEGRSHPRCRSLRPSTLRLLPNPVPGEPFPIPKVGTDESEGVVLYEVDVEVESVSDNSRWIAVRIESAKNNGWVVGGFGGTEQVINNVGVLGLLFGGRSFDFEDHGTLRTSYSFPGLISNALVSYRIEPRFADQKSSCPHPLLPPLILHTSHPAETHYFPLMVKSPQKIILHTHASAPYISRKQISDGVAFTIYSSGSAVCRMDLEGFSIRIDWTASLGRWASRYFTTVVTWSIGLVALIMYEAWAVEPIVPTIDEALHGFLRKTFIKVLLLSLGVALLPLPKRYYSGTGGEMMFASIAPLLLCISVGLVCISWWILKAFMWPLGILGRRFGGSPRNENRTSVQRSTMISMLFVFLLIFLFIPWQVAFLGCWLICLTICASSQNNRPKESRSSDDISSIPLLQRDGQAHDEDDDNHVEQSPTEEEHANMDNFERNNTRYSLLILLFMTWLLPLAAPVLVVWIRTLATAGITTPFDGDHSFLHVAPFLVFVDFISWTQGPVFEKQRRFSMRWAFAVITSVAFLLGPRKAYMVFDVANLCMGLLVSVGIGKRYWGGSGWSPDRLYKLRP